MKIHFSFHFSPQQINVSVEEEDEGAAQRIEFPLHPSDPVVNLTPPDADAMAQSAAFFQHQLLKNERVLHEKQRAVDLTKMLLKMVCKLFLFFHQNKCLG